MIRLARWILGAIAFALAGYWLRVALRDRRPRYGWDPDSGLILRIAPLTPAERAAALERERDPAHAIRL